MAPTCDCFLVGGQAHQLFFLQNELQLLNLRGNVSTRIILREFLLKNVSIQFFLNCPRNVGKEEGAM